MESPCTKSRGFPDAGQVGKPDRGLPVDPCDPVWYRFEANTYYYYSGSEVSLVLKEDPDGSVTDGTIHIYAAGKKIATCRRAPGFPLKRTFEISDYLGNLRNVFFYDYYNTLQLGEAIWYNPFGKQDSVIVCGAGLCISTTFR